MRLHNDVHLTNEIATMDEHNFTYVYVIFCHMPSVIIGYPCVT
jgi:hypothetical protein